MELTPQEKEKATQDIREAIKDFTPYQRHCFIETMMSAVFTLEGFMRCARMLELATFEKKHFFGCFAKSRYMGEPLSTQEFYRLRHGFYKRKREQKVKRKAERIIARRSARSLDRVHARYRRWEREH